MPVAPADRRRSSATTATARSRTSPPAPASIRRATSWAAWRSPTTTAPAARASTLSYWTEELSGDPGPATRIKVRSRATTVSTRTSATTTSRMSPTRRDRRIPRRQLHGRSSPTSPATRLPYIDQANDHRPDRFYENLGGGPFRGHGLSRRPQSDRQHHGRRHGGRSRRHAPPVPDQHHRPEWVFGSNVGNTFMVSERDPGGIRFHNVAAQSGVLDTAWGWGTQVVGTLLVLSLAITPAAAAQRWSPNPLTVTGLSIVFALVAADGGILASLASTTIKPSVFVTSISFGIYLVSRWSVPASPAGPAAVGRRAECRYGRERLSNDEERIALFLDYENLAIGAREQLHLASVRLPPGRRRAGRAGPGRRAPRVRRLVAVRRRPAHAHAPPRRADRDPAAHGIGAQERGRHQDGGRRDRAVLRARLHHDVRARHRRQRLHAAGAQAARAQPAGDRHRRRGVDVGAACRPRATSSCSTSGSKVSSSSSRAARAPARRARSPAPERPRSRSRRRRGGAARGPPPRKPISACS